MNCINVLSFDIVGNQAHFRKPYANTTRTTFLFPPKTTIIGLIGAIAGFPKIENISQESEVMYGGIKEKYIYNYNDYKVNVLFDSIGERKITTINHQKDKYTDKQATTNKQVPFEFLYGDIRYTILIYHPNPEFIQTLYQRIVDESPVYPVSLGTAFCQADLENPKIINAKNINQTEDEIYTRGLVPKDIFLGEVYGDDILTKIESDLIPMSFNSKRQVQKFEKVYFSQNDGLRFSLDNDPIYYKNYNLYSDGESDNSECFFLI